MQIVEIKNTSRLATFGRQASLHALDEFASFPGEFDPFGLSALNHQPLPHQPPMAWIEPPSLTAADEIVNPSLRQLDHELAL
jgi:hypothetical protein